MTTLTCKEALHTVLDQIDYTRGCCSLTCMVAAALPMEVIELAREAIKADDNKEEQPKG